MIGPRDEHPHPVAPQAFQTWKENWCLCAVDPAQRFAAVFHVSLRPVHGEAIFSAKLFAAGREVKHVRRHPIGPDPRAFDALGRRADDGARRRAADRVRVRRGVNVELEFSGRFGVFDFADGPLAPGASTLGEIGRHVFPFPPLRAGARRARRGALRVGRGGGGRGARQPRPLVGLPRRLRLPPPPLDLRELRGALHRRLGDGRDVVRRAQARRRGGDAPTGHDPIVRGRRVRRLLAGAGGAAARPGSRRHLPPDDAVGCACTRSPRTCPSRTRCCI